MSDDSRLTAYRGLYCRDCIPSKKELSQAAASLEKLLTEFHLDKYAELVSMAGAASGWDIIHGLNR